MLCNVEATADLVGLKISTVKTNILTNSENVLTRGTSINNFCLEVVDQFKYLWSSLTFPATAVRKSRTKYPQHQQSLANLRSSCGDVLLHTKIQIFKETVPSLLLYKWETWPLKAADVHALKVFDHFYLRQILGVSLRDIISNVKVRRRCHLKLNFEALIKKNIT